MDGRTVLPPSPTGTLSRGQPHSSALHIGPGLKGTSPVRSGVPLSPVPSSKGLGWDSSRLVSGVESEGRHHLSPAPPSTVCPAQPDSPGRICLSRPSRTLCPGQGIAARGGASCEGRTWASRILTMIRDPLAALAGPGGRRCYLWVYRWGPQHPESQRARGLQGLETTASIVSQLPMWHSGPHTASSRVLHGVAGASTFPGSSMGPNPRSGGHHCLLKQ